MKLLKSLLLLLFVTTIIFGCKKNKLRKLDSIPTTDKVEAKAKDNQYTLTPFDASTPYPKAMLTDMVYKNKNFDFTVTSSTYKLGEQTPDAPQKMCANSGKGQHIHLIVDNNPYTAHYTSNFDEELGDGNHYILAFLSRSYHESIKTKEAYLAKKAKIADNSIEIMADIQDPMLFYSRPKGNYVGDDTKKVMLDFYLVNTDISEGGNYVIAEINGEVHKIYNWHTYYIEGLPMGENTIKLTLVDAEGQLVKTPLNPVTRKFTLVADPAN